MRPRLSFSLLLAASLLCSSCHRDAANEAALQSLQEQLEEQWRLEDEEAPPAEAEQALRREWAAVLPEYRRTRDARWLSPRFHCSLLQLACRLHRFDLARQLLREGADPNQRLRLPAEGGGIALGNSPAAWVLEPSPLPEMAGADPQAELAEQVDMLEDLKAAGADFSLPAEDGVSLPCLAAMQQNPQLFCYLVENGAQLAPEEAGPILELAALHCWTEELQILFELFPSLPCSRALQLLAADCLNTPMAELHPDLQTELVNTVLLLCEHGADLRYRSQLGEDGPDFSSAELLRCNEPLAKALKAKGLDLPQLQPRFRSGTELLQDVCKAQVLCARPQEYRAELGRIGSILTTPTPEMLQAHEFSDAVEAALRLLFAADPAKTQELAEQMPAELFVASEAAAILQELAPLSLSPERVEELLPKLLEQGAELKAQCLLMLLGRQPGAEPLLERYCNAEQRALRTGAWLARVEAAGISDSQLEGRRKGGSAMERKLYILQHVKDIWGEQPTQEQVREVSAVLREIGATESAACYEELAQALNDPARLDALESRCEDAWNYELPEATARYILKHKDELPKAEPQAP